MKNGSFLQGSRCVDQYAEVLSVDAYEPTTATDTTDDDAAPRNCLDEDNIVIVQFNDLFACLYIVWGET